METYASIIDEIINITSISTESIVCLNISNFIFSLLLSFIIELCKFIPLTASTKIAGMNNIFCKNNDENKNTIPFPSSQSKNY